MFSKTIAAGHALLTVFLGSAALLGQPKPVTPSSTAGLELPVIMRQNVVAGTTAVGTKIEAKLAVATLVNGVVVPQSAILSGEVTESVAKSATAPSCLTIRMDSAQWKNGSTPINVYLTAWYYPPAPLKTNLDLSSGLPDTSDPGDWGASNTHKHHSRSQPTAPIEGQDTNPAPPSPESSISKHRMLMKDVESARNREGAIRLTSKRFNIKLDKQTTYVLADGNLLPTN